MTEKKNKIPKEQLINEYLEAEKKVGNILPSTDLTKFGLQPVSKYNQQFGSWRRFLISIGRNVEQRVYTRKTDYGRYFMPAEYLKFISIIENKDHKKLVEYLLHSGKKVSNAREINGKATISPDNVKIPSTQYIAKMMKMYAKKSGIKDYTNFSAQTLCRTFEVWMMSGLGIKKIKLKRYLGRNVRTSKHITFTDEEKNEIKAIIGGLADEIRQDNR